MKKRVRQQRRHAGNAPPSKRGKARSRRALIGTALAVLLLGALAIVFRPHGGDWPASVRHGSASGYNVLLVTLDTTRADHLGCYGYRNARTPALDALAHEGIRFDDAFTVAPVTLPSHATILTGLDPPNHGVRNNGEFRLDQTHTTLAEVLSDRGYQTAAFISAFVLDARFGLNQGFDLYDDNVGLAPASAAGVFVKPIYERSAARVTAAAIRWLAGRDKSRPFFCWVHYFDPHAPYHPPEPYASRSGTGPYDGEIAYMDAQFERLAQTLKRENTWERTLIVVVADHGEGLGEHDEATHAKLIYDSVMRVPLIVACPGLFRDSFVVKDVVVSVADVFPTVLDMLGLDCPVDVNGQSLLTARLDVDRTLYMENLATYLDNGWSPLYGLRRHAEKFILAPRPEYYRLEGDPGEKNNLYATATGARSKERDRLAGALSRYLAEKASIEVVAAAARPLDAEAVEALQSLGYAGIVADVIDPDRLADPKDMMPVMRALDRADALASSDRFEDALAILKAAASVSPRDPRLLLTTAKVYLGLNRRKEAEQAYRAALSIRPSARVFVLTAQVLLADRRLDEAEELLNRAESLDPDYGGIYLARGDLFSLQTMIEEAFASYARAGEVDPYRAAQEAQRRIDRLHEIIRLTTPQP